MHTHPLKNLRQQRGISQSQVAQLAGISQGSVARIEAGGRLGHSATAAAVARALNVPLAEVIEPQQLSFQADVAGWLGLDPADPSVQTYMTKLYQEVTR